MSGQETEPHLSKDVIEALSFYDRFKLTLSLWPYMIPLFVVYFAEYALQSGTWTAIGFPVGDVKARDKFYVSSNWLVRHLFEYCPFCDSSDAHLSLYFYSTLNR